MDYTPKPQLRIAMIGAKGVPAVFGGVERSVDELGGRLVAMGHDVTVYSRRWYTKITKPTYKGMRIVLTPTVHTKHLDAIVHTLTSTVHALFQKYDIIHYHGVGPALLCWIPRLFSRAKVVVSFQSIDREHAKWGWFARQMLHLGEWAAAKFPHVVLASSDMIEEYVARHYHVNAVNLPNGATIPLPGDDAHEATLIAPFGLQSKKYLVVVSRLVSHKAVHEIIAAYQHAKKRMPVLFSEMKLVIVGDTSFTDVYVADLKRQAIDDRDVVFTGYQNGPVLAALMRQAFLGIHASHAEGLPMSVLEIMAYGVPVLASDIAPHREVIRDEHWIFQTGNINALEMSIVSLLQQPQEVARAGMASRLRIEQCYSWDALTQKLAVVYQEIRTPRTAAAQVTRVVSG